MDEEEKNTLQPPLPLHDLDSTTELLGQHRVNIVPLIKSKQNSLVFLIVMSKSLVEE